MASKATKFAGKVAFITGAGQGLGKATAALLAARGASVCLIDMNESLLKQAAADVSVGVSDVLTCTADVTSEQHVKDAVAATLKKFGRIDFAINCAGIAPPMKVLSKKGPHDLAQFSRVMQTNVVGTFNVLRLTAEAMSRNEPDENATRGVIVNTSSIAAFDGQIGQAAYAASKGAVAAMTLPIARELATHGIRVCTIAPGLFLTPMLEALPEKTQFELAATVPFPKRLGRPEEYANLVQSILLNSMLNGETIRLDGALRMQP